jgi:hypothetical protein
MSDNSLVHYTSASAFLSILSGDNPHFRAYDIAFMNDTSEFTHPIDAFKETFFWILNETERDLDKVGANASNMAPSDEQKEALKYYSHGQSKLFLNKKFLEAIWNEIEKLRKERYIFVVSFSTKPDLLSQWRAYCPQGGYNFGFIKDNLKEIASNQDFELVKLTYNSGGWKENHYSELAKHIPLQKIENSINQYLERDVVKSRGEITQEDWRVYEFLGESENEINDIALELFKKCPNFKNPGF